MTAPTGTVADRVIAAITALGDTPDAIADRLRALNIKGRRFLWDTCPLARFIQTIPGLEDARVGGFYVHLSPDSVPLPKAAAEFRSRFDRGVYLDLVDPRPAGTWQEQIEGGAE